MTREEAIERISARFDKWALDNEDMKAMQTLIPELNESEDERIRKALIDGVRQIRCKNGITQEQMIAYLEKKKEPEDKGEISDGYHTFNELYYYRMLYNASFFNELAYKSDNGHWDADYGVHKSKRHHDGEECFGGGWFIVMAHLPTGQISNHYELKYWDLFQIPEKETADEWDGHTPKEAAERLHKYLLGKEQKSADLVDEIKHKLKTIPADVLAQTYVDRPEDSNGQVQDANSSDEEFSSIPKEDNWEYIPKKDNWEYITEFCNKFGRIPKDMDELDVLVSYVMDKKWRSFLKSIYEQIKKL